MRSALRISNRELGWDVRQTMLALGVVILAAASTLLQLESGDPTRSAVAVETLVLASFILIRSMSVLRELNMARDERDRLAHTDHLTGLLSRHGFDRVVKRMMSSAALGPAALLVCEVDQFKEVGDRYGPEFADEALLRVADALWAEAGRQTVIARKGRQEFVVLLTNASGADAVAYADKLRLAVSAQTVEWDESQATVTISIGVAATGRFDGQVSELMIQAHEALREAKQEGGDRIAVAAHGPDASRTRN